MADGGELCFGVDSHDSEPTESQERPLAVVHQEFALLPHLSVAENIALPHWKRAARLVSQDAARKLAIDALSLFDQNFALSSVDVAIGKLALHERQFVEIARALSSGAHLLLLDEPTANLTASEAARLFTVLKRLVSDKRIGVVFVSHRMREIREIADVCTIVRDGTAPINRRPLSTMTDAEIIEQMGQRKENRGDCNPSLYSLLSDPTTTKGTSFTLEGPNFNLSIPPGSVVGLAGAPSGPSKFINMLIGVAPNSAYRLWRMNRDETPRSPRQATASRIGYVTGDRAAKGILASLSIADNIMASTRISERRFLVRKSERKEAARLLETLSIKAASQRDVPATLSGGNQQKILIARWLGLDPLILVLEEPTRGIDIGTKREIYDIIRRLAERGTSVVWWSTEYSELVQICDTVIAFDPDGNLKATIVGKEITEERLGTATGVAA